MVRPSENAGQTGCESGLAVHTRQEAEGHWGLKPPDKGGLKFGRNINHSVHILIQEESLHVRRLLSRNDLFKGEFSDAFYGLNCPSYDRDGKGGAMKRA